MQELGTEGCGTIRKNQLNKIILSFLSKTSFTSIPPGVKQIIYSYLSLKQLVKTVSKLRKSERRLLEKSAIVRENKEFKITIPRCEVGRFSNSYEIIKMEQIGRILPLVDKLVIEIRPPKNHSKV